MAALALRVLLLSVLLAAAAGEEASKHVVVTRVARELDLTSHLAKQIVTITIENAGEKPLNSFIFMVDTTLADNLAFIGAQLRGSNEDDTTVLPVKPTSIPKHEEAAYSLEFPPLSSKASMTFVIECIFSGAIQPHPHEISQTQKQLVRFTGNAYVILPYASKTQSTTITLPQGGSIESFTRTSPVNTNENVITYGPYPNLPAFSYSRIVVHYENNGPFLTVDSLDRLIEISHWGNIAVEEHIRVQHTGATLKGSFSRYDYQRNPTSGQSSVKSYLTLLPAAARDVYYRDEIGNISTSHLRIKEDSVELEIRPRFPLFGGWQTFYYTGYNLPSYEYLYHAGSHYMLKMRFVDHVFDNQVIEKTTVRIILPEGARNIVFKPPYKVEEKERTLHFTYLDTMGRTIVTATKNNLVEEHVADFELHYDFETVMLLQEPLLVVVALYIMFLAVVVIVRLDFSITKDVALLARQQASVILDSILKAHDRRMELVSRCQDTVTAYKQSKDMKSYQASRKSVEDAHQRFTEQVTSFHRQLHEYDPEGAAKVTELQKKAAELHTIVMKGCTLAERLVSDRITKEVYVESERGNQARISRLQAEMDAIVKTL